MVPSGNAKSKIMQHVPIDDEFYTILQEMHLKRYYMGQITFGAHKMEFSYHEHTPNEITTTERVEKYFLLIREDRIKWPEQRR